MGGKKTTDMKFVPYSQYAHPDRRKREKPKETYEQIVQSVLDKM